MGNTGETQGQESEGTVREVRLPSTGQQGRPPSLVTGGEVPGWGNRKINLGAERYLPGTQGNLRAPGSPPKPFTVPLKHSGCRLASQGPLQTQLGHWGPCSGYQMQILGPAQELVAQNLQGIFNNKALGGCGLPNISELSLNPLGELGEKREPGLTQGCQVGGVIPFAEGKSLWRVLGRIQDPLSLQGGPSWRRSSQASASPL